MKTPQMCSGRQYKSTYMQLPSRSGHDPELRSNFQYYLLRSNYSSFDVSLQEKHDAEKMNVLPLLRQNLLPKLCFRKKLVFIVFPLWRLNR